MHERTYSCSCCCFIPVFTLQSIVLVTNRDLTPAFVGTVWLICRIIRTCVCSFVYKYVCVCVGK